MEVPNAWRYAILPHCKWTHPPASLQLAAGDIHVWRAYLPRHRARLDTLTEILAPDERARAMRFRFARDRERFVLARGLLREILHRYLAINPAEVQFSYGPQGKPAIAGIESDLRFNLAHAADLALYALGRERELGIDVENLEHMRDQQDHEQIARRFFSPHEVATLLALPERVRHAAFFRCWTIKEAYIKGLGGGLSIPLDHFDVALTPGTPAAILATRPDPTQAGRWTISLLDPGPGYAAALAIAGSVSQITYFRANPYSIWPNPSG